MESPVLHVPRLRLSRSGVLDDTVGAGSSAHRLSTASVLQPSDDYADDGDDDQLPTPRMAPAAIQLAAADTPASRLRALLSRVPTSSTPSSMPHPISPSEAESDFDPPDEVLPNTPSMARESLKDIFSRALREPGNTPQKEKGRRRRNSIDLSEVDSTPRLQSENGRNKGKRRSLSDDEIDSPSKSRRSETSLKSSQALTFDMLRERLMTSRSQLKDQYFPDSLYDRAFPDVDSNLSFLRSINPPTSLPEATSTPQQSLRMSVGSSFPSQSNLLDQDSEMQHAIVDASSYEDNQSHNVPVSQNIVNSRKASSSAQASQLPRSSSSSHSQLTASDRMPSPNLTPRRNEEFRSSSRTSLSETNLNSRDDQELVHERERGWNKRKPSSRSHTPEPSQRSSRIIPSTKSPTSAVRKSLSRRGSSTSLSSFDDRPLNRSSVAFPAEHGESSKGTEKDDESERERELNRKHTILSRPASSLDFHSPVGLNHLRTNSLTQRTRENSSQSPTSLTSPGQRLHRYPSFHNSNRASSPAGTSQASHDSREESQDEDIVYERERNWNAPRQNWSLHGHGPGSPSRVPSSPAASSHFHAHPNGHMTEGNRQRPRTTKGEQLQATTTETLVAGTIDVNSRRKPVLSSSAQSTLSSGRASPILTPFTRQTSRKQTEAQNSPPNITSAASLSLHSHKLPPNRTPLELENQNYIGREFVRTGSPTCDARKTLPPAIPSDCRVEEETRVNDMNEPTMEERTPKVRTILPPPVEASETTALWSPSAASTQKTTLHGGNGFQKAGISSTSIISVDPGTSAILGESSSVPSPSSPQPSVHSILSTPPRRSSFSSTPKFQTPSPPKGMPELPGPPSSSSGEDEQRQISFPQPSSNGIRSDFSTIKTPRPPGGWSSTPRQPYYESEQGSLASTSDAHHENGLPLPVPPLSRFSSLPARTPAPPGAWMATPAVRRPLQKVRFDNHHSHTMPSMIGRDIDSSNSLEDGSHSSSQPNHTHVLTQAPNGPQTTPPPDEESTSQLGRESSDTQTSPHSRSPDTPRKSPGIRVLDAFGREQLSEDTSLDGSFKVPRRTRRRTNVRILDAMGRDVGGNEVSSEKLDETDGYIAPLNHTKVLTGVRQGLSDLARGLDDMDRTNRDFEADARLHELDGASRAARKHRERLYSGEINVQDKFETMRTSMKNGFSPHFTLNSRIWWGVLFLQLFVVFVMYRISMARARELFLTTYYDPFYSELHLYTSRPDTLRRDMFSLSRTPWLSLLDTLLQDGWKASAGQLRDNIAIIVGDWQRQLWETWGTDVSQRTSGWPPT